MKFEGVTLCYPFIFYIYYKELYSIAVEDPETIVDSYKIFFMINYTVLTNKFLETGNLLTNIIY